MNTQPTALRLADELEVMLKHGLSSAFATQDSAAELRRLHALNQELLEALKLADLLLSGANMNKAVVERKVRAAIAKAEGENT